MTTKRHHWTSADDELIADLVGEHRSSHIANRLGLTTAQVNNRISTLGLSRKRVGIYSRNEIAQILGIGDNSLLRRLIVGGPLKGVHIAGRGRFGQWEITEADLIAFLRENPHVVDRDSVDAVYQQFVNERWITTGEAFRRGAPHPVELEHAFHAGMVPEIRKRGVRWVIPETILPRLVEGRRRFTPDAEHRRQVRMYDRLQARHQLTGKRHVAALRAAS